MRKERKTDGKHDRRPPSTPARRKRQKGGTVGLYKLCDHKRRARDRCEHAWWARFKHARVSLEKWANREIETKTDAEAVFDELKRAVRSGEFDKRGLEPPRSFSPLTFRELAALYKERHVFAKQ